MVSENLFLIHALFMGVFITFVYDILRIIRRVIPHGKLAVSLEDMFFWIYCAIKVFLLMHRESNGNLRWFAVLGALTGMLLYKKFISPIFVKSVSLCLQKVIEGLVKIGKLVLRPFFAVGKVAGNTAGKAKNKIAHGKRHIKRFVKKKLTFFLKVLKMNL